MAGFFTIETVLNSVHFAAFTLLFMSSFVADMDDDVDGEKQNRVLLRPWLENMLENQCIPGLEWFDEHKTMFRVPWKHRSKKDWSMRHSSVFLVCELHHDVLCL